MLSHPFVLKESSTSGPVPILEIHGGTQLVPPQPTSSVETLRVPPEAPRPEPRRPRLAPLPPGQPPEDLSILDAPSPRLIF